MFYHSWTCCTLRAETLTEELSETFVTADFAVNDDCFAAQHEGKAALHFQQICSSLNIPEISWISPYANARSARAYWDPGGLWQSRNLLQTPDIVSTIIHFLRQTSLCSRAWQAQGGRSKGAFSFRQRHKCSSVQGASANSQRKASSRKSGRIRGALWGIWTCFTTFQCS